MPVVQITLTQGRSPQAIRSMISKVTDAIVEAEVAPKSTIRVLVTEIPREHFAAGDVTTVPYKQIVVAMGEGSKAGLSAFDYLIRTEPVEAIAQAA